jgi:HEAT repeat protein
MLDQALAALKTFDWGSDLNALNPIEEAVVASHGKAEAKQKLEQQLLATLQGGLSRDAREYICRKLAMVGSASAVPALTPLLISADSSHMARFALEQIPGPEAAQALRDAVSKASGAVKIGIVSSLGARRDGASVPFLGELLKDADVAIARSAALALGAIGNAEAATMLHSSLKLPEGHVASVIDALLSCAESLLANQKRSEASAIYQNLAHESQPRLVRLAATRGLLACAAGVS